MFRIALVISALITNLSVAQQQTVGLFVNEQDAEPGYTLIAPMLHPAAWLVDMEGQAVHMWVFSSAFGAATRLLSNGQLLRTSASPHSWMTGGGLGGRVELIDWDGAPVWQLDYVSEDYMLHHDVLQMPNGNVLAVVWDRRGRDSLVAAGFDVSKLPAGEEHVWSERIVEFKPILPDSATIVWEWSAWDHLVQDFDPAARNYGNVKDKLQRIDINTATGGDWLHFNAIDYNEELDLIAISVSFLSEIWVIDHSTTTEEARRNYGGRMGSGGDLLYRWGNPQQYRSRTADDRSLFFNHSVYWIPEGLPGAGNLMVFDNGSEREGEKYSTVLELKLPYYEDPYGGTAFFNLDVDNAFSNPEVIWSYAAPGNFYSDFVSGQQRLPGGNTLIAEGMTGRIFEVDAMTGNIVWEYINPVVQMGPLVQGEPIPVFGPPGSLRQQNAVFRSPKYSEDYPGLAGRDLSPKGFIELPTSSDLPVVSVEASVLLHPNYPNPFARTTNISFRIAEPGHVRLGIYDALGRRVIELADGAYAAGEYTVTLNAEGLSPGVYFCRLELNESMAQRTVVLVR